MDFISEKTSLNDLKDICRCCLKSVSTSNSRNRAAKRTRSLTANTLAQPLIRDLFFSISGLDVDCELKEFPKSLCDPCVTKLKDFDEFHKSILLHTEKLFNIAKAAETQASVENAVNNAADEETPSLTHSHQEDDNVSYMSGCSNIIVKQEQIAETEIENATHDNAAVFKTSILDMSYSEHLEPKTTERLCVNHMVQQASSNEVENIINPIASEPVEPVTSGILFENSIVGQETNNNDGYETNPITSILNHSFPRHFMDPPVERPKRKYTKSGKLVRSGLYTKQAIAARDALKKPTIFQCPSCSETFRLASRLNLHILSCHPDYLNLEISNKGTAGESGNFLCQICNRSFKNSRYLSVHLLRHNKFRFFKCKVCGIGRTTSCELAVHMRKHDEVKQKFKCPQCPQEFTHKNAIPRHIRTVHKRIKAYSCDYCSKRFSTRHSKIDHERIHTGERPFSCDICLKTFAIIARLQSHLKTHDQSLLTHACSYCSRRFISAIQLQCHERRHLSKKPHICIDCNKGFAAAEKLETHSCKHRKISKALNINMADKSHKKDLMLNVSLETDESNTNEKETLNSNQPKITENAIAKDCASKRTRKGSTAKVTDNQDTMQLKAMTKRDAGQGNEMAKKRISKRSLNNKDKVSRAEHEIIKIPPASKSGDVDEAKVDKEDTKQCTSRRTRSSIAVKEK